MERPEKTVILVKSGKQKCVGTQLKKLRIKFNANGRHQKILGLKKGKIMALTIFISFKESCALLKFVGAPYLCRFKSCIAAIRRIRQPDAV